MKNIVRFIAFFVLSTLLVSQSLVDVAKKEQERREKLKGKNARVVTNADLKAVKRTPAMTIPPAPAAGAGVTEPGEAGTEEAQAAERAYDESVSSPFATEVLPDTSLVENPEYALGAPDGQFAQMSLYGLLELEFAVKNGPGPDIVVHASVAGLEEMAETQEEGIPAGYIAPMPLAIPPMYGVLVLDELGVWQAIGKDEGRGSQASFDLGSIPYSKRIRIIFQYLDVPDVGTVGAKPLRTSEKEITMGVDAVEALH